MAPRKGWKKKVIACEFKPERISMLGEIWRPALGWERFYRISNMGRVYSLHQSGRLVTGMKIRGGYQVVKAREGDRQANLIVHRMVLEAFVGPAPSADHQGCHNDGDSSNNCVENLRWDSVKGNQADRLKHGTDNRGERCVSAKLTAAAVRQIRLSAQISDREWANRFGVTRAAIKCARLGHTWRNVPIPKLERPSARFIKRRGQIVGQHGIYKLMTIKVRGKPTLKYVR